jgi:hypothetical protein
MIRGPIYLPVFKIRPYIPHNRNSTKRESKPVNDALYYGSLDIPSGRLAAVGYYGSVYLTL